VSLRIGGRDSCITNGSEYLSRPFQKAGIHIYSVANCTDLNRSATSARTRCQPSCRFRRRITDDTAPNPGTAAARPAATCGIHAQPRALQAASGQRPPAGSRSPHCKTSRTRLASAGLNARISSRSALTLTPGSQEAEAPECTSGSPDVRFVHYLMPAVMSFPVRACSRPPPAVGSRYAQRTKNAGEQVARVRHPVRRQLTT
jgi:hypothetical protein